MIKYGETWKNMAKLGKSGENGGTFSKHINHQQMLTESKFPNVHCPAWYTDPVHSN